MKPMFCRTLVVSFFVLICSVLVIVFFPNDLNKNSDDIVKSSENIIDKSVLIEPESYHDAVVSHAEKKDMGLELYRSLQARSAVVNFYQNITGDTDVTLAILEYADKNNIPLSLAFSLAYAESRFVTTAINKNTNDSIDRGLFQLNNRTFTQLSEEEFFNPYINAKFGMSHLRFCIDSAGNEIAGLAMYNAGSSKVRKNGTPQRTLNYVSIIMNYKDGLNDLFRTQVCSLYEPEIKTYIAMSQN